ncbi:MAG: hypothetical protein IJ150_14415 [Bacteroidales bacterium]|nr:hypothetical protein [Bacteroidales bacterium]
MKITNSDRLLYFQIGLSIVLALTLLIINYEKKKPDYENQKTLVSGLIISKLTPQNDTLKLLKRPKLKKMKKN